MSLILLVFLPLIFSIFLVSPLVPNNPVFIRRISKTFASAFFVYSLLFLYFFKPEITEYQFVENLNFPVLQYFGSSFSFGIDGISLVLILLTNFLFLLALIASKGAIHQKYKLYYPLIFVLQTAILGVFAAKDLLLFFVFWELELIPMYLLIGVFGFGKKDFSAMKFLLYTFLGSLFMLGAIITLVYFYAQNTGVLTFDIAQLSLAKSFSYPMWAEILMFLGFFIGFGVKLPIVPIHTWLPDAHTNAPTPVSMILAGVLLKMGAYGLIRINLGMFSEWFDFFASAIIILGVINMLYAAIIAFGQSDLKRLVAYSSISHMGLVLIGLGALGVVSASGAIYQLVAHGFISAGLFMVVGIIYKRTKTREITQMGGLVQTMPLTAHLALAFFLAGLGLPLLAGFVAEILVFLGAMLSDLFLGIKVAIIFAIFCMILTAGYLLVAYKNTFWGNILPKYNKVKDITPHEFAVLLFLIFPLIFFGVCPNALIRIFEETLKEIFKTI